MDASVVERGIAGSAEPLARGAPAGSAHVLGAVTLLLTGVDHPAANFLTVHGAINDPEHDLEPALHAAEGTGDRYTLFVREPSDEVVSWLIGRGLVPDHTEPGMARALIEPPPEAQTLQVERVSTPLDLELWNAIACEVFGIEPVLAEALMGPGVLDDPEAVHLLGIHGTEPCATATAVVRDDLVAIFNVTVRIGQRGLGYGREITWAAIREGWDRGARTAVLLSSEQGHPVYERMGFETVGTFHAFVPEGADDTDSPWD